MLLVNAIIMCNVSIVPYFNASNIICLFSLPVTVYKFKYKEDKGICMAFCFKKGKHSIFPVITHGDEVDFKVKTGL